MGNLLAVSSPPSESGSGTVGWALAYDCRPDALWPLLVCHQRQVILEPAQVHELVHIANSPESVSTADFDLFGDLPASSLQTAARLRASQLLSHERLQVPREHDAAGIESVPVSSAMLIYGSTFGRLLVEFVCRSRRVQLDLVASRARRSLLSHPTPNSCDRLRMLLIQKGFNAVPGERGSSNEALQMMKRLRGIGDREIKLKSLVTIAIAVEFELVSYGLLAPLLIDATSGPDRKPKPTPEEESSVVYLQTFWKYVKSSSTYAGLRRLRREGKTGVIARLLLAFCASTASLQVITHTASVMMLISCDNLPVDTDLPWQALNSLNSIICANSVKVSGALAGADGVTVAHPSGPGVKASVVCCRLVEVMGSVAKTLAGKIDSMDHSSLDINAVMVGLNSGSSLMLLEFIRRVTSCYYSRARHEDELSGQSKESHIFSLGSSIRSLYQVKPLSLQNSVTRKLLRIVGMILKDPENPNFRRLRLSTKAMIGLTQVPQATSVLSALGFKADITKKESGSSYLSAGAIQLELLDACRVHLESVVKNSWAGLLPDLLHVLHFQMRIMSKFRAFPNSRDSRELLGDRHDRLQECFDDLISVIGLGFDTYREGDNKFRTQCSRQAIPVLCDGLSFFLPKASQQTFLTVVMMHLQVEVAAVE